ncbi:MAG: hypothetical protein WBX15_17190, partial [Thermoanaerobaculia bacterium]
MPDVSERERKDRNSVSAWWAVVGALVAERVGKAFRRRRERASRTERIHGEAETVEKKPQHAHETSDANPKGLFIFVICALAALSGIVFIPQAVMNYLEHHDREGTIQERIKPRGPLPPEPRLTNEPALKWEAVRGEAVHDLVTYGWVDRTKGVVRIPIERAMELIAAAGPDKARHSPPPVPMPVASEGAGATSTS